MRKRTSPLRLAAAALALTGAVTAWALAAGVGPQDNPLITLSYLTNIFTGQVMDQVDEQVAEAQASLKGDFDQKIQETVDKLNGTAGSGASSTYSVVTLSRGQRLVMDIGCEVMLRVGGATCVADSAPGLVDMTSGGTLSNGGSLTANHLYMTTIENRSLLAGSDTVKVLVRGGYTIQ